MEWGNTCLNQDSLELRIFWIVTYCIHWATILLDLAIQQEQTENTSLQTVTVYRGYGIRSMPNTIYPLGFTHYTYKTRLSKGETLIVIDRYVFLNVQPNLRRMICDA